MPEILVRKGTESDIPSALELIRELAAYEKALEHVQINEEQLTRDAFGPHPVFEFLVATYGTQVVGISLYYYRYSTWKGKGLYLEDLVVTKEFRGRGIGKDLLIQTAKEAQQKECTGLYWQVLDWNTPAISFYEEMGASFDGEWINCKLDQEALNSIK